MACPESVVAKVVMYAAIMGLFGLVVGIKMKNDIGGALIGYAGSQIAALLLLVHYLGD